MITVQKAIEELAKYPKDANVYAYEGEVTGIVIVLVENQKREELGIILASEFRNNE